METAGIQLYHTIKLHVVMTKFVIGIDSYVGIAKNGTPTITVTKGCSCTTSRLQASIPVLIATGVLAKVIINTLSCTITNSKKNLFLHLTLTH